MAGLVCSLIFPDADIDINIIVFHGRKLPRGQISEKDGQGFVALHEGLLADGSCDQAVFQKFPGGIHHVVGDDGDLRGPP